MHESKWARYESKFDNSFPVAQFEISRYATPYRFDKNSYDGGILLYIRGDIPSKPLHVFKLPVKGCIVELKLHKPKWLLCCIYNPQKKSISDFLQEFQKMLDVFSLKFSGILIIGNFNAEIRECHWKNFCELYDLRNPVKQPTCFKNPQNPFCIDLLLTNKSHSFCNTCLIEMGLSHFHKTTLTVFKVKFAKCKQKFSPIATSKAFLMKRFNRRFYLI